MDQAKLCSAEGSTSMDSVLKVVKETQEMFQKQQRTLIVLLEEALRKRIATADELEMRAVATDQLQLLARGDLDALCTSTFYESSTMGYESSQQKSLHREGVTDEHPDRIKSVGFERRDEGNDERQGFEYREGEADEKPDWTKSVAGFSLDTSIFKPHHETSTLQLLRKIRTKSRTSYFSFNEVQNFGELKEFLFKCVHSRCFDFFMGMIILANSVYIGFELDNSIRTDRDSLPWIEYVFMSVYSVELILRLWAFGFLESLHNNWILLDLLLVGVAIVSLLIIEPIRRNVDSGERISWLSQLILIRLLRILRLVRAFRFFKEFKILWGLVNGLLSATAALVSTFALLFLLLYMFAVCGVELISKDDSLHVAAEDDPDLKRILDNNFDSLLMVMVTLIRFTTADSPSTIYEPLVRTKPGLIVYFVAMLLVVSITIMNLITAVLVEHSISVAKNDVQLENHRKRAAVRKMIPEIEQVFSQLDADQDGQVTFQETVSTKFACSKELEFLVKDPSLLVDLFDLLDKDRSGHIDKDEFTEGLVVLALSDVPMETVKLINYSRGIKRKVSQIKKLLTTLNSRLDDYNSQTRPSNGVGAPSLSNEVLNTIPATPTRAPSVSNEVLNTIPATPTRAPSLSNEVLNTIPATPTREATATPREAGFNKPSVSPKRTPSSVHGQLDTP